jgi:polyisoprenoid-binding protein YceI
MKTNQFLGLLLAVVILSVGSLTAQVLKVNPNSSTITINGTSNLHDWKTTTKQIKGELVLAGNNQVKALAIDVPVKSIKSGEKIMDTKTYETFNADKNPNISFRLTNVSEFKNSGNDMTLAFTGNLTMAGVTKKVTIKTAGKSIKSGSYKFNGSVDLKMSDFKMSAPTAMMGMMKVGDGIKLVFDVVVDEQQQAAN